MLRGKVVACTGNGRGSDVGLVKGTGNSRAKEAGLAACIGNEKCTIWFEVGLVACTSDNRGACTAGSDDRASNDMYIWHICKRLKVF